MKKISFILMAFALVLGLTQCKKNLDTVSSVADGKVYITYSTADSKTNITEAGVVTWTAGDVCHVYASTTGYLGSLTLSSGEGTGEGTFTGSLSAWTDDETLRFYYLGTNTKKADDTFVIDYSAQDGTLATIASKYHVSCYTAENVPASQTSFSGKMLNQMALAVFDVSGFGAGNVKIYAASGFRNQITISDKGVLSYGVAGVHPTVDNQSGHIVIGASGAKKYVALLPSDGEITMQFTSQSKTGSDEACTIAANDFIGSSAAVAITASDVVSSYVDLAVASDHVFSVASGRTVKFAKGNLVYDQGRFKMHSTQYGRCFTSNGDVSDYYKVSGTFDLFGWGTSGWNNGNLLYMPYAVSLGVSSDLGSGYGPTDGSNYEIDLTGTYANSDWGVYQFGMNTGTGWRILTKDEWQYLLQYRSSATYKYGIGHVAGQYGYIILPDEFTDPMTNNGSDAFVPIDFGIMSDNYYTTGGGWEAMEANGAVFLPAAGRRVVKSVGYLNSCGNYWSSSIDQFGGGDDKGDVSHVSYITFDKDYGGYPIQFSLGVRNEGNSIRLVRDL